MSDSTFAFRFAGFTERCPSSTGACDGSSRLDGFNDVGWVSLADIRPSALAIARSRVCG